MSYRHKHESAKKSKDLRANGTPSPLSPLTSHSRDRVQKPRNPRRASARLRGRSPDTPSSLDLPQKPSSVYEEQIGTCPRKRRRSSEEESLLSSKQGRPVKRARPSPPAASARSQRLTSEILEGHTKRKGYVGILELMGSEVNGSRGRGSKRSASSAGTRTASTALSDTGDQDSSSHVTQKSSYTASHYRLFTLTSANIRFQFKRFPEVVHAQIIAIIQRPILKERKEELSRIALKLHNDFTSVLSRAAREDDCVELLHQALSSLGYNDSLLLPRKADWLPSLKPRIPSPMLNLKFLIQKSVVDRSSKRRHREEPNLSQNISGAAATSDINSKTENNGPPKMGPPPTPQPEVKTPRPDISIGLSNDAVIDALESKGLTRKFAKNLLTILTTPDACNSSGEPLLCLGPTKQEMQFQFPFMPIEGKSYATGSNIYEAQNQAAVSTACALEILHRLEDLTQTAESDIQSKEQHIVFSICTQGPIHELWAHYTTEEDGDRIYNSKLWKSCNMSIECEVPEFLEAVDNVMRWGVSEHLEKVANQLQLVGSAVPSS